MPSTLVSTTWLILLLGFAGLTVADYYDDLGVNRAASEQDLKTKYRQLAKELHPDKNKSPDAAEQFAKVSAAYEVLSDKEKREIYDKHGEDGLKRNERRGSGGEGASSIFEAFGFGRRQREEARTANLKIPLRVSLRQLYLGDSFEVEYTRKVLCSRHKECEQSCPECHGPGVRAAQRQLAPGFVQNVQVSDERCAARGKCFEANRCRRECPNGLLEPEQATVTVEVEKGMQDGDKIEHEEATDEALGDDTRPGNLVVELRVLRHEYFERDGDDLKMRLRIPLVDALVGFKTSFEHLDGRIVPIEKTSVTSCGSTTRLSGQGMPRRKGNDFGDLIITFSVDFPERLVGGDMQRADIRHALRT